MNDIIKEKFIKNVVIISNIHMYFIKTARDVISECKKNNIRINGLEAFKLTGLGIQPSQEHSIDFKPGTDSWEQAMEFLSNIKDTTYLYEIWYEGY